MVANKKVILLSAILLVACGTPKTPPEIPLDASSHSAPEFSSAVEEASTATSNKNLLANDTKKQLITAKSEKVSKESIRDSKVQASTSNKFTSWEISGAISARAKNKGWSASLNWLQQGSSRYQMRLFGPLGSGTVIINKNGHQIIYRDGPKTISSTNAEELLHLQTGIRLPVHNLYYWVRGLPAPGGIQLAKYEQGRLSLLKQGNYYIQYLGYTTVGNAVLPTNIRLQGNGVLIKLVIKRWKTR